MTFEVYNQTLADIERKIAESLKNESDIVTKLDDDRNLKIAQMKDEKRRYLAFWDDKFRKLNTGAANTIAQTHASERAVRCRLDESRRRLAHEYKDGKEASHE